jgi:hypothetical protein
MIDCKTSKHTPVYKAAVQRVVDTLVRHEGKLFAASESELHDIRDNIPYGYNVYEIIFTGMKRYKDTYGKKHLRAGQKA